MNKKVLITGGAGFIGSHTADELEHRGFQIRILDNLDPKTHFGHWPSWVKPSWEKIKGDVRNLEDLEKSLDGVTHIIHLAALMDLMPNYYDFFNTNVSSTARIYEIIVAKKLPIQKVLVASSQFVYGEGIWKCTKDGQVRPKNRTVEQMTKGQFEPICPICSGSIEYQPQKETYQDPPNQYAISKYSQELIALKLGRLNNIPSAAMRYSIVHGPRQSLKNAYSGALRIFALKMLSGQSPTIFEDGLSQRDYVSVFDVARANADVLESEAANYENFNVGSGKSYTVIELAEIIAKTIGGVEYIQPLQPCGEFRVGDNRHAVSDISKIKNLVGWDPSMHEEEIVRQYIAWVKEQKLDQDYLAQAEEQMKAAGVIRKSKK